MGTLMVCHNTTTGMSAFQRTRRCVGSSENSGNTVQRVLLSKIFMFPKCVLCDNE